MLIDSSVWRGFDHDFGRREAARDSETAYQSFSVEFFGGFSRLDGHLQHPNRAWPTPLSDFGRLDGDNLSGLLNDVNIMSYYLGFFFLSFTSFWACISKQQALEPV